MLQVVVVGGGPAGLIAAEVLARAGLSTTLIESHPQRLLPCAGLLTPAALAALEAPDLLTTHRIHELAVYSPTQRVAYVSFGGPERYATEIRRELLHAYLRRRAEEAGVVIRHARFRRFLHGDGDYPLLEISPLDSHQRERLAADVVIAADGIHSKVAATLGLPALQLGITYMEHLTVPGAAGRTPESVQIHFGRKIAPERFGWVIPAEDRWTVGINAPLRYGRRVRDLQARLRHRLGHHLDGAEVLGRAAFFFPWVHQPRFVHDRVVFIGDAAGLGTGLTMDGLYYAAVTARLAAEVIVEHQHMPTPDRLRDYQQRFEARHGDFLTALEAFERQFFTHDKHRESLLDLAWERDLHRVAMDAYFDKRAPRLSWPQQLRFKARYTASLLKQTLATQKREHDAIARVMPLAGNYLDLALSNRGTGPLPNPAAAEAAPTVKLKKRSNRPPAEARETPPS
ncbi:MAG: FAD-dependent monooxygenase [Candidatus Sericytochromatia bacterium]|nr:FAD-dependent monooxygenase [Candidatus Sericytochromatia bacterium]